MHVKINEIKINKKKKSKETINNNFDIAHLILYLNNERTKIKIKRNKKKFYTHDVNFDIVLIWLTRINQKIHQRK